MVQQVQTMTGNSGVSAEDIDDPRSETQQMLAGERRANRFEICVVLSLDP
jgi:hypothetical protein